MWLNLKPKKKIKSALFNVGVKLHSVVMNKQGKKKGIGP